MINNIQQNKLLQGGHATLACAVGRWEKLNTKSFLETLTFPTERIAWQTKENEPNWFSNTKLLIRFDNTSLTDNLQFLARLAPHAIRLPLSSNIVVAYRARTRVVFPTTHFALAATCKQSRDELSRRTVYRSSGALQYHVSPR